MRLLLVESDSRLVNALTRALRRQAYALDVASDAAAADELCFVNDYDLIVLDENVRPAAGAGLLEHWRSKGIGVPVLTLTQGANIDTVVALLDLGADDCLAWPFSRSEFLARVRCLLRRRSRPMPGPLRIADVQMSRAAHRVRVDGDDIALTPKEFTLLEYFLSRPDEVISRSELIEHGWDDSFDSLSNVVDVTVHRLRCKIDGAREKRLLHTIKGIGYVMHSRRCEPQH